VSAPGESIPALVRIIRGTLRLLRPRLVAAAPDDTHKVAVARLLAEADHALACACAAAGLVAAEPRTVEVTDAP
jgi:hypothetical protein